MARPWGELPRFVQVVFLGGCLMLAASTMNGVRAFLEGRDRASIPARAEDASAALYKAALPCLRLVSLQLPDCAAYPAKLPTEVEMVAAAVEAIRQRDTFYALCGKYRPDADCHDLILRGLTLQQNLLGK